MTDTWSWDATFSVKPKLGKSNYFLKSFFFFVLKKKKKAMETALQTMKKGQLQGV